MADSPFNVVLAEARAAREMSHKDLARRIGCTTGFVKSYEDCAINPTVRTLFLYAHASGFTVTISRRGVTITNADSDMMLEDWIPTLSPYQREALDDSEGHRR